MQLWCFTSVIMVYAMMLNDPEKWRDCNLKMQKITEAYIYFCVTCCLWCCHSQTVYDEWFITMYNLIYTALPVLGMSLFDQVCTKWTICQYCNLCLTHSFPCVSSSLLSLILCFCRMWMTVGVSSILSSTLQASSTCTLTRKLLSAVWSTAAIAPSFSSLFLGPPCVTRSEMMAKTSLTISPSLCWHRPVC